MLDNLALGLSAALQLKQLLFMVAGTVIGLWVGVLPGLGGPVAMAILIPFTFSMDPLSALLMLASISVGAAFGGSVTSILLNIPGEASSAATAYDGYPMAQQGRAKVAMGLSAGASMAAAVVGVLILMLASGPVAKAALAFSPAEYFALAVLGLTVVSVAALGSTVKGLAMGALGIAISLIGVDSILGSERYTFGILYLLDGISFVPVMVGLFAITELISMVLQGGTIAKGGRLEGSLWDGFRTTFRYPFTLLQSTAVGAFIGIIPGLGATAANFLAYSVAQRSSRHPERFGRGAPEGVIHRATLAFTMEDAAATQRFYTGMMAVPLAGPTEFKRDASLARLFGAPETVELRKLTGTLPPGTAVEFTEFRGVPRTKFHLRVRDPGAPAMAINVDNLEGMVAQMKAAGVNLISANGELVDFGNGVRNIFVEDPNGLNLELIYRPTPPAAQGGR